MPVNFKLVSGQTLISEISWITAQLTPLPFEQVVAGCSDFKCLSYVDDQGIWRDAHDNSELLQVEEWCSLEY